MHIDQLHHTVLYSSTQFYASKITILDVILVSRANKDSNTDPQLGCIQNCNCYHLHEILFLCNALRTTKKCSFLKSRISIQLQISYITSLTRQDLVYKDKKKENSYNYYSFTYENCRVNKGIIAYLHDRILTLKTLAQ